MTDLGFIGLGHMGEPMARRLIRSHHRVTVFNRSRPAVDRLVSEGATAATDPAELANCEIVFTMLPDLPETIDAIAPALVPHWAAAPSAEQRLVVVMSSVSPTAVARFAAEVSAQTGGRVAVVDAPVSGGVRGAESGELSIMVGSTAPQFARLDPLLRQLGSTVLRMGEVGTGSLSKACNQLVVAASAAALGEAVVIAESAGIDVTDFLDLLAGGLAGSRLLDDKRDKLLSEDYSTSGAAVFMLRNLDAVLESAHASHVATPVGDAIHALFTRLVADGFGDLDLIATRAEIRHLSALEAETTSTARRQ